MDFLEKLGFTQYQIKVITSLLYLRSGTASQIVKRSKIPANKVYQTLKDMVHENIVIETHTSPKSYSLVHFDTYLKKRVQSKQEEVYSLENEYDKFLATYTAPTQSDDFWVLKDLDALLFKIEECYKYSTKGSIALIETWVARYSTLKVVKNMTQKGMSVKFMGNLSNADPKVVKRWLDVGTEIKHVTLDKKAGISVFDEKYVKISVLGDKLKTIWGENEDLAAVLQDYLEMLWDAGVNVTLENYKELCENK